MLEKNGAHQKIYKRHFFCCICSAFTKAFFRRKEVKNLHGSVMSFYQKIGIKTTFIITVVLSGHLLQKHQRRNNRCVFLPAFKLPSSLLLTAVSFGQNSKLHQLQFKRAATINPLDSDDKVPRITGNARLDFPPQLST